MPKEIVITIDTDGTILVDMLGYKGEACEEDLKKLLKDVGNIVSKQKKSDYYDSNKTKIRE